MMKVHIYNAKDGWRWHLRARNGRIVAESGEAYTTKAKARAGWNKVAAAAAGHPAVIEDD